MIPDTGDIQALGQRQSADQVLKLRESAGSIAGGSGSQRREQSAGLSEFLLEIGQHLGCARDSGGEIAEPLLQRLDVSLDLQNLVGNRTARAA